MSYGHGPTIQTSPAPEPAPPTTDRQPPVDPALYDSEELRPALAARDITTLYRALVGAGLTQRRIAQLTGQAQSEVSEIIKGRSVLAYDVLSRIADGLVIPRAYMGLSYGDDAYPGGVTDTAQTEELLAMLRRHLLGLGALATVGIPVPGLGHRLTDPPPVDGPITPPGRIGMSDVAVIRDYTAQLRDLARRHGGQGAPAVGLASWADQWLAAEATDAVRRALLGELSELHANVAWCCHDSGAPALAYVHFGKAVELGHQGKDGMRAAYALRYAGTMLANCGLPNDALKSVQLAETILLGSSHERAPALTAQCHALAAWALTVLGESESIRRQARKQLAMARDGWQPPDAHAKAQMDLMTGIAQLHSGELTTAEPLLTSSARTYRQADERRGGLLADLVLALVHVLAGDPRGLPLAAQAIQAAGAVRSSDARQAWLPPLADALDARPGSDAKDLARQARHLAAAAA